MRFTESTGKVSFL